MLVNKGNISLWNKDDQKANRTISEDVPTQNPACPDIAILKDTIFLWKKTSSFVGWSEFLLFLYAPEDNFLGTAHGI